MKHLYKTLFLACLTLTSLSLWAQNNGFEAGTVDNWSAGGGYSAGVKTNWDSNGVGVSVTTGISNFSPGGGKTWSIKPYGTYMASLQPGGGSVSFDSATSSLGLTSTENSAIKSYLSLQASSGGGGNPTPTNATWIKRQVTLEAGSTYSFAWNYLSTDYTPWNDGSMITLTHSTNANIKPTLNNKQQRYGLLGFTNPGTGEYATGSYGSTGWQAAVFTVPETGVYTLGFASFNLGDTALSPILLIDEITGITLLNGQSFGPVAPNAGSSAPAAPVANSYSSEITPAQIAAIASANTRLNSISNNGVYLQVTGPNNSVNIEQIGNYNKVSGIGGGRATVDGGFNQIAIKQGDGVARNLTEFSVSGNSNTVNLWQSRNIVTGVSDGLESGGHYIGLALTGNSNSVTVKQANDGGINSGHFSIVQIDGSNQTFSLTQSGNGGKKFFGDIDGSSSQFSITQGGSGSHYLDLKAVGNGHSASINQKDSGSHKATISLTNSGGASNIQLIQGGSTNQVYSIDQSCATVSGCSVSVTQE